MIVYLGIIAFLHTAGSACIYFGIRFMENALGLAGGAAIGTYLGGLVIGLIGIFLIMMSAQAVHPVITEIKEKLN